MGQTTIEWTATYNDDGTVTPGFTFNPWQGCLKVSPGCHHCYAETLSNRWGKDVWGPGPKRQRTSAANWKKPLQWNKQAGELGVRFKVFCASMADVFEDNPQLVSWRVDLFDLIQETPRLDWLLLTKRPENVNQMIEQATGFSEAETWFHSNPNVWMGTSVENQEYADKRIPELLRIPARIRFLSMEPLLGPVDLLPFIYPKFQLEKTTQGFLFDEPATYKTYGLSRYDISWVIVGGESGHHARPMHPEWVRSLRDQCQGAGVSFFFKQWGNWIPKTETHFWDDEKGWMRKDEWIDTLSRPGKWGLIDINGKYLEGTTTWNGRQNDPRDDYEVTVYEVGKKCAGRLLDGVEYSQFPQVSYEPAR